MSKNILLTGGAGYIGSTVAHHLIDNGYDVTIIDNLSTGHKNLIPKKAKLIISDINNVSRIANLFKEKKFEIVLHFAGFIRVDESVREPVKYLENNYSKTKIFIDNCLNHGLNRVIFSSTASVYGNSKDKLVTEKDSINPLNPYALSKLKVEKYLDERSKNTDLKYTILRYFNVAGCEPKMRTGLISEFATHLIKVSCEVAIGKKQELIINGDDYNTFDGTPVRDYIHISDLAEIHKIAAENLIKNNKSNIYNCGYGTGYSVKQVIKYFNKILEKDLPFKIGPRRESDSEYVVANSKKFLDEFDWKPKYNDLNLIIQSSLDWEKKIKNS